MPWGRVHDQAGRLVDDGEPLVGVDEARLGHHEP
jgi:hypothetical protein